MTSVIHSEGASAPMQYQPGSIDSLVTKALDAGASVEVIERLLVMKREHERDEARKAHAAAMAAFKAEPIVVPKNKHVFFRTQKGITDYWHATLDKIVEIVAPRLSACGLSFRWETNQDGGKISVRCIIEHALGHRESTELCAGADESGGKNSVQGIGSTVSYLQRYTLCSALGIASGDFEDDARVAEPEPETISEEQIAELRELLGHDSGREEMLCTAARISSLDQILATNFEAVRTKIEQSNARRAAMEPKA